MPSRSASSAPRPESPPEQVRIAEPARRAGGRRGRRAPWRARAGRGRRPPTPRPPRARARGTRAGRRRARRCAAAAAAAPTADAPTFSTATPMPASAHAASASHSRAPSPVVLDEQRDRPHLRLGREVLEPVGACVTTVSFPDEIAVWSRSPRRVASALTTRLPLCETSATCPGSTRRSASPHSAAREWSATSPSQFGPQTGSECRSRRGREQLGLERPAPAAGARPRGSRRRRRPRLRTPSAPASLDHAGHAGGRDRDDDRVGRRREVGQRREAAEAVGRLAARVDAPDLAAEARGRGG